MLIPSRKESIRGQQAERQIRRHLESTPRNSRRVQMTLQTEPRGSIELEKVRKLVYSPTVIFLCDGRSFKVMGV